MPNKPKEPITQKSFNFTPNNQKWLDNIKLNAGVETEVEALRVALRTCPFNKEE